jgi:hypothetical protein
MLKNVFISGNFNAAFCGWVYVLTAKTLIPLHWVAVIFEINNFQKQLIQTGSCGHEPGKGL